MINLADFKMPYGAEFSPEKIRIKELLKIAAKYEGDSTDKLIKAIAKTYFNDNLAMGANCKNSMVAYEILEAGGGVKFSSFGRELRQLGKEDDIFDAMAKRILTKLNGMMFVDAIRAVSDGGGRPTIVSVTEMLNMMGCETLAKTNKHIPTMKKWLEKAKVLQGWEIKEKRLDGLAGMKVEEINVLKGLNHAQICFIQALCNSDTGNYQSATKIRELAKASFNIEFEEKSFSANIIKPLEERNIIEKKPCIGTHGGNASEIKLAGAVKADVLAPILRQIEVVAGKEVVKYIQKPLDVLRREIDADDTHIKGLALEAFAIRLMRIAGLDFAGTRVKGSETGGAEVDVIFDTTRLNYSRWQVQCKNTPKVSLDQVAKEVGLSHVLKTNVIVIMTTGLVSKTAKDYAAKIMKEMNLCIVFIERDDIREVMEEPSYIVNILNRESMKAKRIKVLDLNKVET